MDFPERGGAINRFSNAARDKSSLEAPLGYGPAYFTPRLLMITFLKTFNVCKLKE